MFFLCFCCQSGAPQFQNIPCKFPESWKDNSTFFYPESENLWEAVSHSSSLWGISVNRGADEFPAGAGECM